MMFLNTILILVIIAACCRWIAYNKRVALPRRFLVGQRGFWFPPWPAREEFATETARRLDVIGRILIYIVAIPMFADAFMNRASMS